jgi:UDP-2-acetamido-3-amino-2,3-dideoxy-glucuronate N-acetyltransferase
MSNEHKIKKICVVGAGTVVTKNVPDFALFVGNPGRTIGWVDKKGLKLSFNNNGNSNCKKFRFSENKVYEV